MATKTFSTMVQLEGFIQSACTKAVKITCNRLLGKLQELIESEYYDAFEPREYSRTYQFYRSAMTEMLSQSVGMIFMNPDAMNYPFGDASYGWAWSGQQQIEEANKGIHGGWVTEESVQHHYWDSFEDYCDKNAIKILKEELVKQRLKLSK